jgi:integrase
MDTTLTVPDNEGALAPYVESAREYMAAALAGSTKRAYRADWRAFVAWCEDRGVSALPASSRAISGYLAHLADTGRKVSTIGRALAAISEGHRAKGYESPRSSAVVKRELQGIRRRLGVAPEQKAPVLVAELRDMVRSLDVEAEGRMGLQALRDRALLLVGFAGAFRRSELVALNVGDLQFTEDGVRITVRRSKTDQEGEGREVGIAHGQHAITDPVRALRAWLEAAGIERGPIFRAIVPDGTVSSKRASDKAVARLVKRAANAAGLDPATVSGHSLRAGLVTSAAMAGRPTHAIMKQTGHKSDAMVRRYIRAASLFKENVSDGIGL